MTAPAGTTGAISKITAMSNRNYSDHGRRSTDDDDREFLRAVRIELLEYLRGLNRDRRDREWYQRLHETDRVLGYPLLKYPGEI